MPEIALDRTLTEASKTTFRTQVKNSAGTVVALSGHTGKFYWRDRFNDSTFTEETANVDAVNDFLTFQFPAGIPAVSMLEFYFEDIDGSTANAGEERYLVRVRGQAGGE